MTLALRIAHLPAGSSDFKTDHSATFLLICVIILHNRCNQRILLDKPKNAVIIFLSLFY